MPLSTKSYGYYRLLLWSVSLPATIGCFTLGRVETASAQTNVAVLDAQPLGTKSAVSISNADQEVDSPVPYTADEASKLEDNSVREESVREETEPFQAERAETPPQSRSKPLASGPPNDSPIPAEPIAVATAGLEAESPQPETGDRPLPDAIASGEEPVATDELPLQLAQVSDSHAAGPGAVSPVVGSLPAAANGASGMPVQWSEAPVAQAVPQPSPAIAPGAAGQWVMVWIPYGAPTAPVAPTTGVVPGSPVAAPQPGYYPAWVPLGTPQGMPVPAGAAPAGQVPWSQTGTVAGYGYPYAVPQPMTATAAPPPAGVAPQYYPGQPPYPPIQGYYSTPGLTAPPVEMPLQVPTAPSSASAVPTLPAPPNTASPAAPTAPYPTSPVNFPDPISQSSPPLAPTSTTANPIAIDPSPEPLTDPSLDLQGLYIVEGDDSSARARLSGSAFLTPSLLVGGSLDLVTGPDLTNDDGVQLTELYLATAIPGAPGLRFRFGQLDLTSYFDRNSFAKDASRDFFNSTFQTNPALIAGANVTASRPAGLVQWNITDNIALSSAVFSSDPDIADFDLNGFAGEISVRTGDLIVRGTFISSEDSEFQGTGDRLESYGLNAEWFIPNLNIGFFGRYGELRNAENDFDADTYSIGLNALDVFMENDRLGVAYGRGLETDPDDGRNPDVLELFYDFELLPNIRTGFTIQQRNSLSETFAGFRIRSDIDLTPSVFSD